MRIFYALATTLCCLTSTSFSQRILTAEDHFMHGVTELRGETKSTYLANEHFRRAIDLGSVPALKALADSYYSGDGVGKNLSRALILYIMAADEGYGPAQFNAGAMLMHGEGGKVNLGLAFFYLQLASQNEDLDELCQEATLLRNQVKERMTDSDIKYALKCINHCQKCHAK